MTIATKAMVCAILVAAGFLSRYLNGPLPYVLHSITINKNELSTSLNKTFPSFLATFDVTSVLPIFLPAVKSVPYTQ